MIDVHSRNYQDGLRRADLVIQFPLESSLAVCVERVGDRHAVVAPLKTRRGVEHVHEPYVLGVACPCVADEEIVGSEIWHVASYALFAPLFGGDVIYDSGVAVCVGVGVAVGLGVSVWVGVGVIVGVAVAVAIAVGVGVDVAVGV